MMKRYQPHAGLCTTAMVFALLLGLTGQAAAQDVTCDDAATPRTCTVEPGVATLNLAVDGDTTETGARVDSSTVYVLRRGGLYILNGSVENEGYPLTLVAEEGDGERPRLVPGVAGGGEVDIALTARGDLTIRDLYVTNQDELGGLVDRIIRLRENDIRLVIDNCHLDRAAQSAIRVDNPGVKIYILNSTVSNIGTPESPNNGRGIDDRGNDIDSVVVRNSTFYNLTSRVLRDDGGLINYAEFNHNTFYNIGQFAVSFGPVLEAGFTNNLVINAGFYANEPVEMRELVQVDSLPENPETQMVDIRNNNFYLDPDIATTYPDTVTVVPTFNAAAMAYIDAAGTGDTNIEEAVTFTTPPALPDDILTTYYADPSGPQEAWNTGVEEGGVLDPEVSVLPFDFTYNTDAASYTASTAGQPLGALTWFGINIIPVAAEDEAEVPSAFRLRGNYPNPFNPATTISFDLPVAAEVSVAVFDLLGRQVMAVPAQQMAAGSARTVSVDAARLASGVYLYQVRAITPASTLVTTGQMVLLK